MHLSNCVVTGQRKLSQNCFSLFLREVGEQRIASSICPGHFVNLHLGRGYDPFLRRPFSVYRCHDDGTMEILYIVTGKGTTIMSAMREGDAVNLQGPLGNHFEIRREAKNHLLIAGGIGIAPFYFLAEKMLDAGVAPQNIRLLFGGRTKELLYARGELESLGITVECITDDGSSGRKGFVTELLRDFLAKGIAKESAAYACGPNPMFKALQKEIASAPLSCQASLEERMACGIGVCNACIIGRPDAEFYDKICKHGPVFELRDVVFGNAH